jgi:hypothetical protein
VNLKIMVIQKKKKRALSYWEEDYLLGIRGQDPVGETRGRVILMLGTMF